MTDRMKARKRYGWTALACTSIMFLCALIDHRWGEVLMCSSLMLHFAGEATKDREAEQPS